MTEVITSPPIGVGAHNVQRGATEGPLKYLIPVYIDVETYYDETRGISLSSMTLRQYIQNSHLTSIAIAVGESEVYTELSPGGVLDPGTIKDLRELALSPAHVFVCHNASFDIRVLRFMLKIPQPINVWCSMEGAMGAWPECVGGYSLSNLGKYLALAEHLRKIHVEEQFGKKLSELTNAELKEYNGRDVISMREVYLAQIACLPAQEQEIALMTHFVRQFKFMVDPKRLLALIKKLDQNANDAQEDALEFISMEEMADIFNRDTDDGALRSVRVARLAKLIQNKWNMVLPTTSLKKLSPIIQAKYPEVTALLRQSGRVNKMLSHGRRSKIFKDIPEVDVELGYFRAHTGRFSSPSTGKGLNLHNIPKHDKSVAQPVREVFRMPPDKCLVRADLANVEFRVEGWLCRAQNVLKMFDALLGGNIFNDPYCLTWTAMTGAVISKKDPVRQVAKAAVLGLGFCMSAEGFAKVLLGVLADPKSGVTEASLAATAKNLGWVENIRVMKRIKEHIACNDLVANVAFHVHRLFNEAYPEFTRTADWIFSTVEHVANVAGGNTSRAKYALDHMYESNRAPDRDRLSLEVDMFDRGDQCSIRVKCGPWPQTVCWREPLVRMVFDPNSGKSRPQLTILKATGQEKAFTRQLAIENVTQAAARNSLCIGLLDLKKLGHQNVLHIHDEIMLIVDRNRDAVLKAKDTLLSVFGPGSSHPLGWAIVVKPEEVTVTESMWEDEGDVAVPALDAKTGKMSKGNDRWGKIERNEKDMFAMLP